MEKPPRKLEKDLQSRLIRDGDFLVDLSFKSSPLAEIIWYGGAWYYRYMDRIFCPHPINDLSQQLTIELCNIRLSYFQSLVNRRTNSNTLDEFLKLTSNIFVSRVLDFGCGNGTFTAMLQNALGVAVTGVDVSKNAIEVAKKLPNQIEWLFVENDKNFPFSDHRFDLIVSSFVMHFEIQRHVLKELNRVLTPSGLFIFNIFNQKYFKPHLLKDLESAGFIISESKQLNKELYFVLTK